MFFVHSETRSPAVLDTPATEVGGDAGWESDAQVRRLRIAHAYC